MARFHRRRQSKEYMAEYRENNRDKLNSQVREWKRDNRELMRERKLIERYGINIQDYDAILDMQGGGCAICGSETPKRKNSVHLVVDHCHETGVIRGLLCYKCNVGLGSFEDNIDWLKRAIEYVGDIDE